MKCFHLNSIKFIVFAVLVVVVALWGAPSVIADEEDMAVQGTSNETAGEETNNSDISQTATQAAYSPETPQTMQQAESSDNKASVAAKWVSGELVELTSQQLADFEDQLYSCKTKEEYEALMDTLAYYNKGVDLSQFSWYWDEMEEIYSDEQIAMMKNGKREWKAIPNVVGMEAMKAYRVLTDAGFLARLSYEYNVDCTYPVGYCFEQEFSAGTIWNTDASFFIKIQAPASLGGNTVSRNPDDEDFDIEQEIQYHKDNDVFMVDVPNVIGLSEADAIGVLRDVGMRNIDVVYQPMNDGTPLGYCHGQTLGEGYYVNNTETIVICIQSVDYYRVVPNVVGMYWEDAIAALEALDFNVSWTFESRPKNSLPLHYCLGQSISPGTNTYKQSIKLTLQAYIPPEPTLAPTQEPTPEPTIKPTPEPAPQSPEPTSETSAE